MAGYSRNLALVVPELKKPLGAYSLLQNLPDCRYGTQPKEQVVSTFVEGACPYAGVDGDREATMIFTIDARWPDCAKQIPFIEATTKADAEECGTSKIHPTGFIVASDSVGMNDVSSPLYESIDRILNRKGFSIEEIPVDGAE